MHDCRIPPGALAPDGAGRTLLSRWVVEHMEGIAARAEARELADSMLKSEIEVVDGYRIGPGRCVIDDAGIIVPISKCTIKELRAEAKARDIDGAEDMKRPELLQAIKVGVTASHRFVMTSYNSACLAKLAVSWRARHPQQHLK